MINYNTTTGLDVQKKDVKFLDAGIHEDVSLTGAKYGVGANGSKFIEIEFSKNGQTLTHTEYEPTRFADEDDASLQSKADSQVKRLMQILLVFYKREMLGYNATSFEDFARWIVSMLSAVSKDDKVRIKAVYNAKGYTGLPRYFKFTFIESMNVSKNDSMIKELGIDTFERPKQAEADKEVQSNSAEQSFIQNTTANTATAGSDLPF